LNRDFTFAAVSVLCLCARAAGSGSLPEADRKRAEGDLDGARRLYAAEAERLRGGADRLRYGRIVQDLGETELAAGRYREAAGHGLECAAVFEAAGNPAEQQIGCFTIAGRARVYEGEYAQASEVLQRALQLARAKGLAQGEVAALNDIGSARYYMGDYSTAHDSFTGALALVQRSTAAPWYPRLQQITLANLAMLQQRLGQYDRALEIYRSLASGAQSLQASERARLLSNMGALYRRLGDPYKAIDQYRAAELLFAKQQDHDGETGVATNTGIVLAIDLGDLPGALHSFRRAYELASHSGNRREQSAALMYASETLRRQGDYRAAMESARQSLALSEEIRAPEEQWKARLSLAKIAEDMGDDAGALAGYRSAIEIVERLRTGISGIGLRSAFLGDKAEAYDGAIRVLLRSPAPDASALFRYMEQGRARTLRDRIAKTSAPAGVKDIQKRLGAGVAVAEYWKSGEETAALWITASATMVVRCGRVRDDALTLLVEKIRAGGADWEPVSKDLGSALLGGLPLANASIQRLIVIPDRGLQSIPFDVLTVPQKNRLLIDDYEVSYLPAASMLPDGGGGRGWILPWQPMVVGFADPSVHESPGANGLFAEDLAPLPESNREIREVAEEMGGRAELHAGADNRKMYITSALAGVPILHFATHGIADPDDPDRSRLALSGATAERPIDYLFAREVYDLNLTGVRVATLAACDTEAGKMVAGEGVAALSRAFLSAGAQSTVSTLWRISDNASAEFMQRFYASLSEGDSAGGALRSAKLVFRNSGSKLGHARHWAAYVLNGDAGTRTPRPVSPPGLGAGVLGCLACFAWLVRRSATRNPTGESVRTASVSR
jgi:tetratricopeptide (TPR) repeat protein